MKTIELEIIMPLITTIGYGCRNCSVIFNEAGMEEGYRKDCTNDYPSEWQKDIDQLLELIGEFKRLYKHRLHVKLIDAQSPSGLWKQIRHRLSQMPAFIVDNKFTHTGWDKDRVEALIDQRIKETL